MSDFLTGRIALILIMLMFVVAYVNGLHAIGWTVLWESLLLGGLHLTSKWLA